MLTEILSISGAHSSFEKNKKMYPKSLQKTINLLMKFPGVGPRQAARFAFFLMKEHRELIPEFTEAFKELAENVTTCSRCFRSMEKQSAESLCNFCLPNGKRTQHLITVVEKESDMQNLERTGAYQGTYHLLGGTIAALDADSPKRLHLKDLYERVKGMLATTPACELILATNPTTEGDVTAIYIERVFTGLKSAYPQFKISRLARGLSLGAELEYADEVTLKQALINRK